MADFSVSDPWAGNSCCLRIAPVPDAENELDSINCSSSKLTSAGRGLPKTSTLEMEADSARLFVCHGILLSQQLPIEPKTRPETPCNLPNLGASRKQPNTRI